MGWEVGAECGTDDEVVAPEVDEGSSGTGVGTTVWFALGVGISAYESTKISSCAPSLKLYRSV